MSKLKVSFNEPNFAARDMVFKDLLSQFESVSVDVIQEPQL